MFARAVGLQNEPARWSVGGIDGKSRRSWYLSNRWMFTRQSFRRNADSFRGNDPPGVVAGSTEQPTTRSALINTRLNVIIESGKVRCQAAGPNPNFCCFCSVQARLALDWLESERDEVGVPWVARRRRRCKSVLRRVRRRAVLFRLQAWPVPGPLRTANRAMGPSRNSNIWEIRQRSVRHCLVICWWLITLVQGCPLRGPGARRGPLGP